MTTSNRHAATPTALQGSSGAMRRLGVGALTTAQAGADLATQGVTVTGTLATIAAGQAPTPAQLAATQAALTAMQTDLVAYGAPNPPAPPGSLSVKTVVLAGVGSFLVGAALDRIIAVATKKRK